MIENFLALFEENPTHTLYTKKSNAQAAAYLVGYYSGILRSADVTHRMNDSQFNYIQEFIHNPNKKPFDRTGFFLLANDDSGIFPIEVDEIYRSLYPISEYILPRGGFRTQEQQTEQENIAQLTLKELKTDAVINDSIQKYCRSCMKERTPVLRSEIYKLMLNIE